MSNESLFSSLEMRKVRVLTCHVDAREIYELDKDLAFELQAGYSVKAREEDQYWYARIRLRLNWDAFLDGDSIPLENRERILKIKYISTCELRREKNDQSKECFIQDALPTGLAALLSSARAQTQAIVALIDFPVSLDTPLIDIKKLIESCRVEGAEDEE